MKKTANHKAKEPKVAKIDPQEAMPAALDLSKATLVEVISRSTGWGRSQQSAASLLEALSPRLTQEDLNALLGKETASMERDTRYKERDVSASLFSIGRSESDPAGLAWTDLLIKKGADPFFAPVELERSFDDEAGSYFEALLKSGHWSFADSLLSERPDQAAGVLARLIPPEKEGEPRGYRSVFDKPNPWFERFVKGGPQALALAFKIGFDPNRKVGHFEEPWVFSCASAPQLAAFVAAGADLSAKSKAGLSAEERFCQLPPSKEREALLAGLRSLGQREALSPEAATKAVMSMAVGGSKWPEIKKAAKAHGLDPLNLRTPEGDGVLAVAAMGANWGLVAALLDQGVDPLQKCSLARAPAIGWALVGSDRQLLISSRKESDAAASKREALEARVFGELDYAWRASDGSPLMETVMSDIAARSGSSFRTHMLSHTALNEARAREPMSQAHPLWSRLIKLDAGLSSVESAALKRPAEPWVDQAGLCLAGWLLAHPLEKPIRFGYSNHMSSHGGYEPTQDKLSKFVKDFDFHARFALKGLTEPERQRELDGLRAKIFAPEQWESVFKVVWRPIETRSDVSDIADRVLALMKGWIETADRTGAKAFDFPSLSKALLAPLSEADSSYRDHGPIEKFLNLLCEKYPDQSGGLFLDALAIQTHYTVEWASKLWTRLKGAGVELALPGDHPLLCQPGLVRPYLAHHPVWRDIEASLIVKETERPKGPRM